MELYYPSSETKALISFAVTGKLICAFVFASADCWFSHGAAHFKTSVCFLVLVNVLKMHSLNSCLCFCFSWSFPFYAADRFYLFHFGCNINL